MSVFELALSLPENLYRRAERAARLTHREVEEILTSTLEATLPFSPKICRLTWRWFSQSGLC